MLIITSVFPLYSSIVLIDHDYGIPKMQKTALKNLDVNVLTFPNSDESSEKFRKDNSKYLRERMMLTYTPNGVEYATNPELRRINEICKNKLVFRNHLKHLYPDFFYRSLKYSELETVDYKAFPYPVVVKPTRGYCSMGVYRIEDEGQWLATCKKLERDNQIGKNIASDFVFNPTFYIVEEALEGDEFAVDGYYDATGKPVILNIMKRKFLGPMDTSDRIYYTSVSVVKNTFGEVTELAKTLGNGLDIKLFPVHFEARRNNDGKLIPIEINPMRFASCGLSDLSFYAYGINSFEYYFTQKEPDWNEIFKKNDGYIYGSFDGNFSKNINYDDIAYIKEDELKSKFSDVLDYQNTLTSKSGTFFALIFYKTPDIKENSELLHLLHLNLDDFIVLKSENKYDWLTSFKEFFQGLNPWNTASAN